MIEYIRMTFLQVCIFRFDNGYAGYECDGDASYGKYSLQGRSRFGCNRNCLNERDITGQSYYYRTVDMGTE